MHGNVRFRLKSFSFRKCEVLLLEFNFFEFFFKWIRKSSTSVNGHFMAIMYWYDIFLRAQLIPHHSYINYLLINIFGFIHFQFFKKFMCTLPVLNDIFLIFIS